MRKHRNNKLFGIAKVKIYPTASQVDKDDRMWDIIPKISEPHLQEINIEIFSRNFNEIQPHLIR